VSGASDAMNRIRSAWLVAIAVVCLARPAAAQQKSPERVSLVRLAASPESYDGKLVEVSGYLVLAGSETGGRLYVHREDAEKNVLANSIRVERTEQMETEKSQLDRNFVDVVGVFRQGEQGNKGTGLLHEIRSCKLQGAPPGEGVSPREQAAVEAAVASDLRTLNSACVSYAVAYSIGYPLALANLGPSRLLDKNGAGLVDQELASGVKHGYQFTYTPGARIAGRVQSYTLHADPLGAVRPGPRHFFTDQTGVIRVNASGRASVADKPSTPFSPPESTTPAAADKAGRLVVSEEAQEAKLINKVAPRYPPLAQQARIQGTVRLRAVIAKDGTVAQCQVLSGPPLLIQAAIDAVKQWRYQPTVVNGQPVEVETDIAVVFSLGGNPPPGAPPGRPQLLH